MLTYKYLLYSSYKSLNCKLVIDIILNQEYQALKTNIDGELAKSNYLTFFIDESANIKKIGN